MSDNNDSGGFFGAIISALILVAIWPYLLALLGIYIAYLVAVTVLGWIAEHWVLTGIYVAGALGVYAIFYYRLIPKAWRGIIQWPQLNAVEVSLHSREMVSEVQDLAQRKFTPSTNLYCYWCTKKLGIKAWERDGRYYCNDCLKKL